MINGVAHTKSDVLGSFFKTQLYSRRPASSGTQ
jgi:hypothetical protein